MENYIVSARKYRPQSFQTVIGQNHISTTLKNAIHNNQLAHAFLFCGPRGVGKTTCARILAKTINCENPQPDGEACEVCVSCKNFNEGRSMNIHELDAASNNSVEDIRNLTEQVRFAPQTGKYKVYIVDEVHMLSTSAFNAFLKTLEEPPSYAIFILATTEKHKILPTILSRCQIFDFKRMTTEDTVLHLSHIIQNEQIEAEQAALHIIAQKSEGCMRDALSILDKIISFTNGKLTYQDTLEHLNILDYDYYFQFLEALQNQDMVQAMLLYDEVNKKGFEGDLVLNGLAETIRNILLSKDKRAHNLLDVVEDARKKYQDLAQTMEDTYLISALNILNEAEQNYKSARNKKLLVEMTLIKLSFLKQAIQFSAQNTPAAGAAKQALNFRNIPSIKLYEPNNQSAKLFISPETKSVPQPIKTLPTTPKYTYTPGENSKKNLLDVLREKAGDQYIIQQVKEVEPLEIDKLKTAWQGFIELLQTAGDKPSTVNTFQMAQLEICSDIHFKIIVYALTQQKFIAQEKLVLAPYIQNYFNNRKINFSITVEDNGLPQEALPLHLTLNTKQKYEKLVEQYPLIKELKEKLKLELN